MARIAGVNVPLNKRVEIGLTYIYGIGQPTANQLLSEASISPDTYVRDLTDDEVAKLRDLIDREVTGEGDGPEGDAGGGQEEGREEVSAANGRVIPEAERPRQDAGLDAPRNVGEP